MSEGILLAIIGIIDATVASLVTFFLTRRKYRVGVQSDKIDNDTKDLSFYITMVKDNKVQLEELQKENREQRHELAEMRSVVFSMLQQICTDMMCQNRSFDREKCPYYELLFKEIKEDNKNDENE